MHTVYIKKGRQELTKKVRDDHWVCINDRVVLRGDGVEQR